MKAVVPSPVLHFFRWLKWKANKTHESNTPCTRPHLPQAAGHITKHYTQASKCCTISVTTPAAAAAAAGRSSFTTTQSLLDAESHSSAHLSSPQTEGSQRCRGWVASCSVFHGFRQLLKGGVAKHQRVCDCVRRVDGAELTEDGKTRGDLSREWVSEPVWDQQGVAAVLSLHAVNTSEGSMWDLSWNKWPEATDCAVKLALTK